MDCHVFTYGLVVIAFCFCVTDGCNDVHSMCKALVKNGLSCKREEFIGKACPKSCDFCSSDDSENTDEKKELELKDVSIIDTLIEKREVCKDEIKSCSIFKTKKMCNHIVMEKKCKKTCNFCGANCADKQKACPRFKSRGYCEKKPALMEKLCQSTCGKCPAAEKVIQPNTKPEAYHANSVQPAGGNCVNDFPDARCEYYANIGWCTKNQKIKDKCQKTCVCDYVKPEPPKLQSCNDHKFGCCSDKKTPKEDTNGSNCPGCKDDPRFEVLCGRFGDDCNSDGHLGASLRKYCLKTCGICT